MVINSTAGVERDVHRLNYGIKGVGVSVIKNLDDFSQINLCAVRAGDGGHLFHTAAHWRTWGGLDIPTLAHVIVHADEEQVVCVS